MKIIKLRLKNFRSYEKEVEFNFSTSGDKNIILIGGKNGSGKSTIFESIKLCIYGPIAYRYLGFSPQYINRIKSNINNNAFKSDVVNSYISIDIEIKESTSVNVYTLTRKWTFNKTKLSEQFVVFKNYSSQPLSEEENVYFQNYLKSVISPDIFDFFFFDGENLSEFFIGRNSNIHLKQALLSLCNYDTLDILKSILTSSSRANKNDNSAIADAQEKYLLLESSYNSVSEKISKTISSIKEINNEIQNLTIIKNNLEKSFKQKGGILAEERNLLSMKLNNFENRRKIINQDIKNFCNDILPFLLIKNKLHTLQSQIEKENKFMIYSEIKDNLNSEFIYNILKDKLNGLSAKEIASHISLALIETIKPDIDDNHFKSIHKLSTSESSLILSYTNEILNFDKNKIYSLYSELEDISMQVNKVKNILNSRLEDESVNHFVDEISIITSKISEKMSTKNLLEDSLEELKISSTKLVSNLSKAKDEYIKVLKRNSVVDATAGLLDLIEEIISDLIENKAKEVSNNFMYIFQKLITKDRFLDSIHIDSNFNITLYIDKVYSSLDIKNMLDNMGYDEMNSKLGDLFFDDLNNFYQASDRTSLIKSIKSSSNDISLSLKTKLDINSFSSGEKQIYILCLYWALIKSSDISIPFVIDTPYARIDESHRNNLTSEYLSNISDQVIILSTDTEINMNSYIQIKPNISYEYMIVYDDKERRTKKFNRYFFEV